MDVLLPILSKILTAAVVGAATVFLLRTARPAARREGGAGVIEYGRGMRLLVVVCWVFVIGVRVLAEFAAGENRFVGMCVSTAFFFLVLALHLEVFHVEMRYDAEGLRLASPWRGRRVVPWAAITGAEYSHLWQWHVLKTAGYGHIRLHMYLSGIGSLRQELAARGIELPVVRR